MTHWYRKAATSDHPIARLARKIYRLQWEFSLPAWCGWPVIPLYHLYRLLNAVYLFLFRVFIAEPVFRSCCTKVGKNFHAGALPAIRGKGSIILGDNVLIDGRCLVFFAVRYADPRLIVGDNSGIGHDCVFTVGREIVIGKHCRVASGVVFFDSPGHPVDPARRQAGHPANPSDVRPIVLGDNVWIGTRSTIFPGVTIGDNSIVAYGSVVTNDVPANVIVAGNPARQVAKIPPSETAAAG